MAKKILIASDHAGFPLKEYIKSKFVSYPWDDLGVFKNEISVDYPDYALKLSSKLNESIKTSNSQQFGILVCKSGQGMAIVANKFPLLRAVVCWSEESARLSREHNDANVLCLSENLVSYSTSEKILKIFLNTKFLGGRHKRRIEKINTKLMNPKITHYTK